MPERHSALMGPRTAKKHVVAFDLETGALHPDDRSVIVQIAAVRMSPDLKTKLSSFKTYIHQPDPDLVTPDAAKVNGYHPDDPAWRDAEPIEAVLPRFMDWLYTSPKPRLLGHNIVGFDIPILKAWCERLGISWKRDAWGIDFQPWDVMLSHVPLKQWGGIDGLSLASIAAHHGVRIKRAHDAVWDAWACVEIAQRELAYLWAAATNAQYALGFWGHHSDPATREHRLEPVEEAA